MEGSGGSIVMDPNVLGEPGSNGDTGRGDGVSGSTGDYSQWVAQMQAYYKQPQAPQPQPQAASPYYNAMQSPHAYANIWSGQAPMMTPYGAPAPFYPYPHPGMPPHQAAYGGYAPPQTAAPVNSLEAAGYRPEAVTADLNKDGESKVADAAAQEYWRQRQAVVHMVPPGTATAAPVMDYNAAAAAGLVDEREAKRQRRKQSNRESARRSRLRKQAECEDLGTRVTNLSQENMKLRAACLDLGQKVETILNYNRTLRAQVVDQGGTPPEEPELTPSLIDEELLKNVPAPVQLSVPHSDSADEDSAEDDEEKKE
mmetsp:Transcript_38558/g.73858  ORF Transcript_38558/g.73858 Transcript_38558/m.73858 type:complete len:312 (+) Transcript_38558:458-1393(+)|eukprot:CAMPEP_0114247256 /NCGR_PEP_ID=MMETSP0058-20121206/12923_1 /TAXON_ID=36894 /ORGANISM="Pyramimonas parkeae, CCMP726" /LENGTH=311 /DNA_ID=CAMNT_0001360545 /DNA_START=443 /DNA_END=1378 /DNA_ORIENTATION=+